MSKFLTDARYLLFCLFGLMIVLASSQITYWIPPWIYQIAIGGALLCCALEFEEWFNPRIRKNGWVREVYDWFSILSFLAGLLILLNFGRYDEILDMTGPWPLWLISGTLIIQGMSIFLGRFMEQPLSSPKKRATASFQ